ncbi:MAG: hypothetical protein WA001_01760 [Patescibacteria group bacterium]
MNKQLATTQAVMAVTLAATLLSPALVSAATVNADVMAGMDASGTPAVRIAADFCTNLTTWNSTVDDRLTAAQATLATRQSDLTTAVQDRKTTRGQDLTDLRTQQDADRASIYAQLAVKATTDSQKQALAQFETTIDAAMQARRASVDAALAAYWQGIDGVLATRQAAVQKTEQDFSTSLQSAFSAATSSCNAGTSGIAVRTTFGIAVRTAASTFTQDRKGIDKAGPQIKALAQTRNLAIAKAIATFKTAAQAAEAQLKVSFAASASATTN